MSLAVVLKGYPRLSETFIAQELKGLQDAGVDFAIYSLRRPHDSATHPIHREITAAVNYLPEYLHDAPWRVLRAWWQVRRRPGYRTARRKWLRDLRRDPTRNRIRRFGQALVLATELPTDVSRIYAHFLHTPASVARYAADMRGLPWSCSAHAKDIYTSPDWDLREKLVDLDWLVTCTAVNVSHLRVLGDTTEHKIHLLYHGLDFTRFPSPDRSAVDRLANVGADPARPVRILSVGRAVEKKGYGDVLQALAQLPATCAWHFTHIGGGDLRKSLMAEASALGLADRITWRGAEPQAAVIEAYRTSDIFILASRIADDGDRDGLPNVLMEAQSQRLACLSTNVSAIPELIVDGVTGLLVPPGDVDALAEALETLIRDGKLRTRLGDAGEKKVRREFSHTSGMARLLALLGDRANSQRATDDAKLAAE